MQSESLKVEFPLFVIVYEDEVFDVMGVLVFSIQVVHTVYYQTRRTLFFLVSLLLLRSLLSEHLICFHTVILLLFFHEINVLLL